LDLGVNGPGFFILNNDGAISYTRNGQFKLDAQNNIVSSVNGFSLVGIRTNGTVGPLSLTTQSLTPKATTLLETGLNLNSSVGVVSDPPSSSDIPFISAAWEGAAANAGNPATDTYNNTTSSTVYDSLGNAHVVSMYFIKADDSASPTSTANTGPSNTWYVAMTVDGVDVDASAINPGDNSSKLYSVTFNEDGSFKSTQAPGGGPTTNTGKIPVSVALTNGATNPFNFDIDFSNNTQFGSPFAVQALQADGYSTGSLTGLSIDGSGKILGRYSNGQTPLLGTIQLANFADPNGLQNLGDNRWAETFASGKALVSEGGSGGVGLIQSGATEGSNVDLTTQLVKLTVAQRAFQSNAQVIKTGDSLIQTLLNSL
jgi:flagellar hook protein FlgE